MLTVIIFANIPTMFHGEIQRQSGRARVVNNTRALLRLERTMNLFGGRGGRVGEGGREGGGRGGREGRDGGR